MINLVYWKALKAMSLRWHYCSQTSTYLLFMRLQHILFLVVANMYRAFKFNLSVVPSIFFKKGHILQSKSLSINYIFTTFNGLCSVYSVCVCMSFVLMLPTASCFLRSLNCTSPDSVNWVPESWSRMKLSHAMILQYLPREQCCNTAKVHFIKGICNFMTCSVSIFWY